ncbi:CPBP family intramembrane glutamic endopeptidase [Corynebacterium sanguinis]|uniref:CPBP family intramembrane glutamic endopeptidase n=1 Tax=Corynebacterium sanguinis TaxID=2594913 RepID=UPI0011872BC8|nr:CPBP family intramembrane glutamic endopeptidase [Corynebacterium sanguinis]MCT1613825.1 CPBP family intramembrane metalloprotease [Corynebacterium sanguinis]MCT1805439.1 CPBP family intramembrane metalloprotease [Corynebacterium sanguinis]MCT2159018.1 CPBP family intramembrane metalloprotease [Corynebacterium sanguinis]
MAAGLYYVRNFRGVEYADPAFIQTFFLVLVVLASATVAYCLVFREEAAIPWERARRWGAYAIVMVPLVVLLAVALVTVPPGVALIGLALVAIGEEVAFRQVFFGALLKRSAAAGGGVIGAVVGSALAFSALHAVSVLGGRTATQVASQMLIIFLAGIVFACLFLSTKSLVAVIAFHWIWDALVSVPSDDASYLTWAMPLCMLSQTVVGLVVLWRFRTCAASAFLAQPRVGVGAVGR